ncbi:MAG: CBS domain-containing protein [Methanothrix sp.]|nr:CBS domain-containing protein [Methanothrix sp.]
MSVRDKTNNILGTSHLPENTYFLSDVLKAKITIGGKKIGKLSDLVIMDREKVAEVIHLVISRPFGNPSLVVPWEKIRLFETKEIAIDLDNVEKFACKIPEGFILLSDHIMDKKILDMEDNDVELVYDIKMVIKNNKLYVTDVDPASFARLRRLGLSWLADLFHKGIDRSEDKLIPWLYVQPLPMDLGSFTGNVKLKILKEKLNDLPPVDLVEILEDLDHEQRVAVINQLDTEQASDALEEIGSNMQREIISSLKKEKVAQLLDIMTPGQAADVLSVLAFEDRKAIMKLMDEENIDKIKAILGKLQDTIINIITEKYIRVSPDEIVEIAQNNYPRIAKDKDEVMYLFVVDAADKLLGVIDVKDLLRSDDRALLKDIMVKSVITLKEENTLGEASAMFSRYDFRALPITDRDDKMVGVVRYRDVTQLTHHFLE